MKIVMLSFVFFLGSSNITLMLAQSNNMVVEGSIQIGQSDPSSANPGSIRWTGLDFEGWNGRDWISLTGDHSPPAIDVDGNYYRTVVIGEQVWMAENLRTTKYRGGTAIPEEQSTDAWRFLTTPAYCWNDNDSTQYAPLYGALYNWYVTQGDSVCPTGWHVPEVIEWDQLADFLGGMNVAGEKLKQKGTTLWNEPNRANDSSGFTALPGGFRGNGTGLFKNQHSHAYFWTATETSPAKANDRFLRYDRLQLLTLHLFDGAEKDYGFSIRCVKD